MVGNSGSGKTALARQIAARLDLVHVELDALHHGPGWTPAAPEDFRARVESALAGAEGWVVCGNYSAVVEPVVWPRADTVIVLDLPKAVVMQRIVRRTLRRTIRREELWNGNREPLRNLWASDPQRNIIRWAWVRHAVYRERYRRAAADHDHAHLDFVFLRSPAEVAAFTASIGG